MNNLLDQKRTMQYESFGATPQIYSEFRDGRDFILGYALIF
ncbi:MAG: hypothetical protein O2867_01420 [Bacteroidetes bacterium]|nr:hypothetical protein [Bacteroidota bacterium]